MNRVWSVRKYVNGQEREIGVVLAETHTLADTKALRLFGRGIWTVEKEKRIKPSP